MGKDISGDSRAGSCPTTIQRRAPDDTLRITSFNVEVLLPHPIKKDYIRKILPLFHKVKKTYLLVVHPLQNPKNNQAQHTRSLLS